MLQKAWRGLSRCLRAKSCTILLTQPAVAPHWYIRHGARDRDTAFPVPINLALMLRSVNKDVDFKLPWNRPHSGDYALDELFRWIKQVVH